MAPYRSIEVFMFYSLARRAKLDLQRLKAVRRARAGGPIPAAPGQQVFIVACGRSGTSILGRALAMHGGLAYVHDQVECWGSVDPRLDLNNLHFRVDARLHWDEPATPEQRERYARLFHSSAGGRDVLVEKTPHNVFRIGWLRDLVTRPRFIHIVRDGRAVVSSIDRLGAGQGGYRIFGRADYNQWWGSDNAKWRRLAAECPALGYWPDAVAHLTTHIDRGAYEWLTSLGEADRWRHEMGADWIDVRYESLAAEPRCTLSRLVDWMGLTAHDAWLDASSSLMHAPKLPSAPMHLHPSIADAFDDRQRALGYGAGGA